MHTYIFIWTSQAINSNDLLAFWNCVWRDLKSIIIQDVQCLYIVTAACMYGNSLWEQLRQTGVPLSTVPTLYDCMIIMLFACVCTWKSACKHRYDLHVYCDSVCGGAVCLYHVVCARLLSSPWVVCGCVKRGPDGGLAWWRTFTSHTRTHAHTRKHIWSNTLRGSSFCCDRSNGCMATRSWIIMIKLALIFLQSFGGTTRFVS